jgi:PTS system mannose-specific IIA component
VRTITTMVSGIIVTHGRLAEELLETAKRVYGSFTDCYAVTNEGKSPGALHDEIDSIVRSLGDARCVVFVDFVGGSCCHACTRLKLERADIPVVTGVNLPMHLAFLNKRDSVAFDRLPDEILDRGVGSIHLVDPERV